MRRLPRPAGPAPRGRDVLPASLALRGVTGVACRSLRPAPGGARERRLCLCVRVSALASLFGYLTNFRSSPGACGIWFRALAQLPAAHFSSLGLNSIISPINLRAAHLPQLELNLTTINLSEHKSNDMNTFMSRAHNP